MAKNNRFQYKLWRLVNTPNDAIKWHAKGHSILINFTKFRDILTRDDFCKSSNMSSFIRQLNLYGFKTVISLDEKTKHWKEYCNPYFIRGHSHLLQKIARNGKDATLRKPRSRKIKREEISDDEFEDENFKTQNVEYSKKLFYGNVKIKEEKADDGYGSPIVDLSSPSFAPQAMSKGRERIKSTPEHLRLLQDLPLAFRTRNRAEKLADILGSETASTSMQLEEPSVKVKTEMINSEATSSASTTLEKEPSVKVKTEMINSEAASSASSTLVTVKSSSKNSAECQISKNVLKRSQLGVEKESEEDIRIIDSYIPPCKPVTLSNVSPKVPKDREECQKSQNIVKGSELPILVNKVPLSTSLAAKQHFESSTVVGFTKPCKKLLINVPQKQFSISIPHNIPTEKKLEEMGPFKRTKTNVAVIETAKNCYSVVSEDKHRSFKVLEDHPVFTYRYNSKAMLSVAFYGTKDDYQMKRASFMDTYGRFIYPG